MDVSLRTPHGDADVRIAQCPPTTTLRDLVREATGQSVPRVVSIDGHAVDADTALTDSGLLWGSVIDSNPVALEPASVGTATLAQIAGPGAGRSHRLVPGRYRIGPGRRSNARELDAAPVLDTVIELVVDADGAISLDATSGDEVTLDGAAAPPSSNWSDGQVVLAGRRAFTIDRRPPESRRLGPPAAFGTVLFVRPPRRPPALRQPVIEAVREATGALPSLWERRIGQPDALSLCVGVTAVGDAPVTVELDTHRVVTIAGSNHGALARTVAIEATTVHGPADLDVVIATTPERLADWDWAKWLPHVRIAGRPSMFDDADSITDWARRCCADHTPSGDVPWSSDHVTLLVVDDPGLWQRRGAPLHPIVEAPPDHLRVLTTCDTARQAPATTSLLLEETADGRWQRSSPTTRRDGERFVAALVDADVAADIARALAPLADHELPPSPPTTIAPRCSLEEYVIRDRDEPLIEFLIASGGARLYGAPYETARTAAAIGLRLCSTRSTTSCWLLDLTGSPWTSGLDGLPHVSPHSLDPATVDPERLLARLQHHLGGTDRPDVVLVLVDRSDALGTRLVTELGDADRVVVLAIDSATTMVDDGELATVSVGRVDGRRRARLDDAGPVVDLDDDEIEDGLVLQPAVYGRAFTALERRIARRAAGGPEEFVSACRRIVATIPTPDAPTRPPVLAVPSLPVSVDADALLAGHPGDAIPIGIVDDPTDDHRPLWWAPGHGHLLAVGPAGSDVDNLVSTVLVGLVERFGDADAGFVLVDGDAGRRAAAGGSSRCEAVLDRDDAGVVELLDRLGTRDDSPRVLVIDDVGDLRRRAETVGLASPLDAALTAPSDLTVIAVGRSIDDLGPLAGIGGSTVLAESGERCRRLPSGDLVRLGRLADEQLATLASRLGTDTEPDE